MNIIVDEGSQLFLSGFLDCHDEAGPGLGHACQGHYSFLDHFARVTLVNIIGTYILKCLFIVIIKGSCSGYKSEGLAKLTNRPEQIAQYMGRTYALQIAVYKPYVRGIYCSQGAIYISTCLSRSCKIP